VFDGHSGDRAAEYCKKYFSQLLLSKAEALERGDTCLALKECKCNALSYYFKVNFIFDNCSNLLINSV
jgi:serine/threonine protein phosphatase PrpC